jgi:hypothetical protein
MAPHYYLMKCKKILRLEGDMPFAALPLPIRTQVLEPEDVTALDQDQANWRVVIFRDEILDLEEFTAWLDDLEASGLDADYEPIAN